MRKMNKIAASMIALVMVIGMLFGSIGAYASSSSIIDGNTTTGKLTINKKDENGVALTGAGFTLYKIMSITVADNKATYTAVAPYDGILDGVSKDDLGNYSAAEIEALAESLLPIAKTDNNGIPAAEVVTPAEGENPAVGTGTYVAENLNLGYYMVVETVTPDGYIAGSPFFVSIPSTNNYNDSDNAGTSWVYDVVVEPKNTTVPLSKNIITAVAEDTGAKTLEERDTVAVGDTVKFVVETIIPQYADEYFIGNGVPIFSVTDTMSVGLKFNNDIKIYLVSDADEETESSAAATTWEQTDTKADDAGYTVTFKKDFIKANRGEKIRLYYSATVTESAVTGTAGNTNEAVLKYANNPQDLTSYDEKDDETFVYTFNLAIEKYAVKNSAKTGLENAEFALYSDAACTDANIVRSAVETDTDGKLTFARIDAGTYYLKEVKSPTGYKLLPNPIKVEIIPTLAEGEETGEFTLKIDGVEITATTGDYVTRVNSTGGVGTVAVENTPGFQLPATGGMGVVIYVAIGLGGLVLISFLMIKRKKA